MDSIQIDKSQGSNETVMELPYQELSQSLINIKNNIMECIHDLENTTQINPSLIYTMENSMKDIDRAKKAIYAMKNFNFKST